MRAIKWKLIGLGKVISWEATVGHLQLYCSETFASRSGHRWCGRVHLPGFCINKCGPSRKSPDEAKADAARLAYEFLLDWQTVLECELKNWE